MKKLFNALIAPCLVLALMLTSMFTTSCDAAALQKAKKAGNQLADLSATAIEATKTAYSTKLITLEQKNSIADSLIALSYGGKAFSEYGKQLEAEYGKTPVPQNKLIEFQTLFDKRVVTPFVLLLSKLDSSIRSEQLRQAIAAIRIAVLTVSAVFTTAAVTRQRISETEPGWVRQANYAV
jgi:hypothetical protein